MATYEGLILVSVEKVKLLLSILTNHDVYLVTRNEFDTMEISKIVNQFRSDLSTIEIELELEDSIDDD